MKITQDRVGAGCLFLARYPLGGSIISIFSTMAKCWEQAGNWNTAQWKYGRAGLEAFVTGKMKVVGLSRAPTWLVCETYLAFSDWSYVGKHWPKNRETGLVNQILARRDRFFFVFLKCLVETLGWHDEAGWFLSGWEGIGWLLQYQTHGSTLIYGSITVLLLSMRSWRVLTEDGS